MAARSSARKPTPSSSSDSSRVGLRINARLKAQWKRALARLESATRKDALAWDQKYETIGEIVGHDPPLYLAGGCATVREFVDRYVHESERVVRDWVAVAEHASPEDESKYTPTKLAAVLAWLDATGNGATVVKGRRVAWEKFRVTVKDAKGVARTRQLVDLTTVQIRALTQQARGKAMGTPAKKGEPGEVLALRRAIEKIEALEGVRITWKDGTYTFAGVPGYALADLAGVLRKAGGTATRKK